MASAAIHTGRDGRIYYAGKSASAYAVVRDGITVYYSYDAVVAFVGRNGKAFISNERGSPSWRGRPGKCSMTTARHIAAARFHMRAVPTDVDGTAVQAYLLAHEGRNARDCVRPLFVNPCDVTPTLPLPQAIDYLLERAEPLATVRADLCRALWESML